MSHANARTNVFAGQLIVREDEVTARLDEWIAILANPEDLAAGRTSTRQPVLATPACNASFARRMPRLLLWLPPWSLAWPWRT